MLTVARRGGQELQLHFTACPLRT